MPAQDETERGVASILSTPVYGEALTVVHVAPQGPRAVLAAAVASVQAREGWRSTARRPNELTADALELADAVVLWGREAGECRAFVGGRRPTVVMFEAADVRPILTRPTRWWAELRSAPDTNLLLVPSGIADRYTRWGPPVPLAHRPDGLPEAAAVTVLSAWVARAYAFGRRPSSNDRPPAS